MTRPLPTDLPAARFVSVLLLIVVAMIAGGRLTRPVTLPRAVAGGSMSPPDMRLDCNLASAMELDALPGIGPAMAHRIVVDRGARGPFVDLLDLQRVKGLGPTTAERIAPYVVQRPGAR